jgi:peptidoglycan/LPS O-acetylase OafA/YrhL
MRHAPPVFRSIRAPLAMRPNRYCRLLGAVTPLMLMATPALAKANTAPKTPGDWLLVFCVAIVLAIWCGWDRK